MGWLETFLNILLSIGALLIDGLICSFLIILSAYKDEIWEEIYERNYKKHDKRI